jgi:prefoldin subunit 5
MDTQATYTFEIPKNKNINNTITINQKIEMLEKRIESIQFDISELKNITSQLEKHSENNEKKDDCVIM